MDNREFSIELLRSVTRTIKKLQPHEADQLASGLADLVFLPPGAELIFPGPDAEEVQGRLVNAPSRQDATRYLDSLKLKKADLVSLAKQLDIAVSSKDTVAVVRRKLIQATVGARQDSTAIRTGSWKE